MNVLNFLKRPEYVFRPRQAFNRLKRGGKGPPATAQVTLPWGATVQVCPKENVGGDIFYYGIFDRIVPETIYRLTDEGELALEAGSNIGQNCSLMAYRTGRNGHVIAFEPHPEIFEELKFNWEHWPEQIRKNVQLEKVALGETTGEAWLAESSEFETNRGSASITAESAAPGRKHRISVRKLDEYMPASARVGVFKIDVEGHELAVLKGAQQSLERRAVRDIIFEDFNPKPSPVTEFLSRNGFTLFELHESWFRPRLALLNSGTASGSAHFSSNYLATLNPERALQRFRSPGWRCLLNL
jgi:FkbM family methyltransferase